MKSKKYKAVNSSWLYPHPRGTSTSERQIAIGSTESNDADDTYVSDCRNIVAYRKAAISLFNIDSSRQERIEEWFLSKHLFLAKRFNLRACNDGSPEPCDQALTEDEIIFVLADWYTLFNRKRQDYRHNHTIFWNIWKSIEDLAPVEYAIKQAMKMLPSIKPEVEEKLSIWLRFMYDEAQKLNLSLDDLKDELQMDTPAHPSVFPWLAENVNTQMPVSVLTKYFSSMAEIQAIEKEKGHYSVSYSQEDLEKAKDDMMRVEEIRRLITDCKKWAKKCYSTTNDILTIIQSKSSNYGSKYDITKDRNTPFDSSKISRIIDATKNYFLDLSNDKSCQLHTVLIESVILSVVHEENKENEEKTEKRLNAFPFTYMMICACGRSPFKDKGHVNCETFVQKLHSCNDSFLYGQRSIKKQNIERVARIKLLYELNCAMEHSREIQLLNWELFLHIHGAKIRSEEERLQWNEITKDLPELSPIILQLKVHDCIANCLPAMPEDLFSYSGRNVIQSGGFFIFLDQHPLVVPELKKRIRNSKSYWHTKINEFLHEAYTYDYNPNKIRENIGSLTGKSILKWDTIPYASYKDVKKFCGSLYSTVCNLSRVEQDIEQLRCLLLEYAMKECIAEQLRERLSAVCSAWLKGLFHDIGIQW